MVHLLEEEVHQQQEVVGEVMEGEDEEVRHQEAEEQLRLEDEGQRRPKKECLGFKRFSSSSDLETFAHSQPGL